MTKYLVFFSFSDTIIIWVSCGKQAYFQFQIMCMNITGNMDNTFTIRLAGPEDAVKVHDIMAKAYESLSDKSFFICDDLPYVENIINNPQEGFAL